jgi:putative NIF3 family GTP cyclohydrolase 1 type 2
VVTGVSANLELFTRAREEGADLVLVHHGLFWAGPPRALDRASKRRLQLLFDADLALAAYHLPLDGHLEVGNNALLAAPSAAATSSPSQPTGARPSASARASPTPGIAPAQLVARVREATRARAAGLHRRAGPGAHDRHRLGRRGRPPSRTRSPPALTPS